MTEKLLDIKGNEIKVGSLVKAKGSSIIRQVVEIEKRNDCSPIRIKAVMTNTQLENKWWMLSLNNVEVVG